MVSTMSCDEIVSCTCLQNQNSFEIEALPASGTGLVDWAITLPDSRWRWQLRRRKLSVSVWRVCGALSTMARRVPMLCRPLSRVFSVYQLLPSIGLVSSQQGVEYPERIQAAHRRREGIPLPLEVVAMVEKLCAAAGCAFQLKETS
jgi:hypothetical protein